MFLMAPVALPFEAIRIAVALAGALVGTYFDLFNKKNVPETFLYLFLALAFLVNLAAYNETTTMYGIVSAIIVFAAFFLLYKAGQLGGADVFILTSITLLLPVQPTLFAQSQNYILPSLPFIINVILASGLSFMLYMIVRSFPIAIKALTTPGKIDKKSLVGAFAIVLAFGAFSYVAASTMLVSPGYFAFISIMILLSIYFTIFKNAINDSMLEWVSGSGVEAEDILAIDKMDKEFVKKHNIPRLIDAAALGRIKHIHEKKLALYSRLPPFLPHVLIGLVVSILCGNIIFFFANLL
jgi:Flp pilus assembly protein protease CpaA